MVATTTASQDGADTETGPKPPVVLLVEDPVAHDDTVAAHLHLGFPCALRRATSLAEALVELAAPDLDLVLTDLDLPDADGLAGLRTLLERGAHVPVVVLTGRGDADLGAEAVRSGAQDFLPRHELGTRLLARTARYAIERHRHQRELRATRASLERSVLRFSRLVARAPIGMALVDGTGVIRSANLALQRVLGAGAAELEGRPITGFVAAEHRPFLLAALADPGSRAPEVRLAGGEPRWFSVAVADVTAEGEVELVVQLSDITARRRAEHALQHAALHDALTGLPNRTLFLDRLTHAHQRIGRDTDAVGVIFLDLDDFKDINDQLGHRAGDAVLTEFAQRLQRATRATDTAARFAGDEFVVVLEHLNAADDPLQVAERIFAAVRGDVEVDGRAVPLHVSVGVAVTDDPGLDVDDLVHCADEAMYESKERDRPVLRVATRPPPG